MRRLHTGSPAAATVGVAPARRGDAPGRVGGGGRRRGQQPPAAAAQLAAAGPLAHLGAHGPSVRAAGRRHRCSYAALELRAASGCGVRRGRRCATGLPLHNRNGNAPADRACATAAWAPLATNWGGMARPEGGAGEQGALTDRRRCQDADPAAPRVVARLLPPPTAQRAALIGARQLRRADGGAFYPCTLGRINHNRQHSKLGFWWVAAACCTPPDGH